MNFMASLSTLHAREVRATVMSNPTLEAAILALPPDMLWPEKDKPHLTYIEIKAALPRSAINGLKRLGITKEACKSLPLRCWVKMPKEELLDTLADIRTRRQAQAEAAQRAQAKRQRNKAIQLARVKAEPPMPILRPRSSAYAGAYA